MGFQGSNPCQSCAKQMPYLCYHLSDPHLSFYLFGSDPAMLRGYSWLCILESRLEMFERSYGMPRVEARSTICKAGVYLLYYISDSDLKDFYQSDCAIFSSVQNQSPCFTKYNVISVDWGRGWATPSSVQGSLLKVLRAPRVVMWI